jgi:hypothetical protein
LVFVEQEVTFSSPSLLQISFSEIHLALPSMTVQTFGVVYALQSAIF